MEIVTYPDKFLSQPTDPVKNIDPSIMMLIEQMADIMYRAPGVGLAANQVGINKSIVIFDETPTDGKRDFNVIINPKIIKREGEQLSELEGCLSVPDFRSNVKRNAFVSVEALDQAGNPVKIDAEDMLAIILQHEIDHLNGILFIDRISTLKREIYKRRMKKMLRHQGAA